MSKYALQDIILDLPDANYSDFTTNVLQFPKLETSLVINRFQIAPNAGFEKAVNDQIQSTKKQVPDAKMKYLGETELGLGDNKLKGVEYSMGALVENQYVQQYQFYSQIGSTLLIISYGKYIHLLEGQSPNTIAKSRYLKPAEWQHIKDNFRLPGDEDSYIM